MFAIDLANDIADAIAQMEDGAVSSIAHMAHHVFGDEYDGDMFLLMDLVLFACAERGVYLDYHEHDGKEEGLPYSLTFVKRSAGNIGPLPEDTRICVLHHPLRSCVTFPGMKYEDFCIDRADVVFDGPVAEAKERYWKCDSGSGFTIDSRQVDKDSCVTILIDGACKKPFEALFSSYGEAVTHEVGLCDAVEEWTFIVYRGNVDVEASMEDYRKVSDTEYVSICDEQERDDFFARFPSSD